jgi:hypothetical protein
MLQAVREALAEASERCSDLLAEAWTKLVELISLLGFDE